MGLGGACVRMCVGGGVVILRCHCYSEVPLNNLLVKVPRLTVAGEGLQHPHPDSLKMILIFF